MVRVSRSVEEREEGRGTEDCERRGNICCVGRWAELAVSTR